MIARAPTRRVAATRMSRGLAARLDSRRAAGGFVHSVFERAANVLDTDGRLTTLLGPGPLAAPFALALDCSPEHLRLEPGMPAVWGDGTLVVGDVEIDWRGAATVALRIAPNAGAAPLAAALATAEIETAAALASPRARNGQRLLGEGLRRADARSFVEGAVALVGLGEGLTPAGDDVVLGALAVAARLRPRFVTEHSPIARAILAAAERGTTLVAREFLAHALAGDYAEPVAALAGARSVAGGRAALVDLLRLGATSGHDTAHGMRVALAALGASESGSPAGLAGSGAGPAPAASLEPPP